LDRLRAVASIVGRLVGSEARYTLDGNEQFEELSVLADMLDELTTDAIGTAFLERLVAIEQPLARQVTFDPQRTGAMARLTSHAPVLIDEADDGIEAFPRAVELGYRGVSVKNCKGVFRALLNRCLCVSSADELFQSAEDLTNLPVVALQQDLATVAALGLAHVERNGHHYFRGLDHLPAVEAGDALAAHPDLYERDDRGVILKIRDGCLQLDSLQQPGYGYAMPVRCDERVPLASWRRAVS
ncbi:MAG: mandelate racemase, partial [Planctomycetota bacterium]